MIKKRAIGHYKRSFLKGLLSIICIIACMLVVGLDNNKTINQMPLQIPVTTNVSTLISNAAPVVLEKSEEQVETEPVKKVLTLASNTAPVVSEKSEEQVETEPVKELVTLASNTAPVVLEKSEEQVGLKPVKKVLTLASNAAPVVSEKNEKQVEPEPIKELLILVSNTELVVSEESKEETNTETISETENLEEDALITTEEFEESVEDTISEEQTEMDNGIATLEETTEELEEYSNLKQIEISKDMDLTQTSGLSKEEFGVLMSTIKTKSDKASDFFEVNSDILFDIAKEYEINEIFFCALIAGESGWDIASNHRETHNYTSMKVDGELLSFSSLEEGLEASARLLHEDYLTEGGSYYNGITLDEVKIKYCPDPTWEDLIYGCMELIIQV